MNRYTTIFVYGTLQSGQANCHRLSGQSLIGPAKTVEPYFLFDLGSCPAMVERVPAMGDASGESPVHGEVWKIDQPCLKNLDWFESHPTVYCRRNIKVRVGEGKLWNAWAYFMHYPYAHHGIPVADGIWRKL